MKTINILNEKGNVVPSVRSAVREQVINYLTSKTGFVNGPNCLYLQVAEGQDGSPVYAALDLSISLIDPTVRKAKKVADKEPVSIENLFD